MPVIAPPLEAQWIASTHAQAKVRDATLASARRVGNGVAIPAAELRARIQHELRTPGRYWRYGVNEKPTVRNKPWWQILTRWVTDRWDDLWNALRKRIHVGKRGGTIVGDGLILLALLVLGVLGARLIAAVQFRRDDRRVALSSLETQRSAHALYMRASAAADRGDFSTAVRWLFAAAVTLLDLRGVMHDDASATVNELEDELLARGEAIRAPFVAIADTFTVAAYAEKPVGIDAWTHVSRAYEALSRSAVVP